MKRKSIYNTILAAFIIAAGIFTACTKENTEVKLPPQLATSQVLDVKSDSATVIGFVVAAGSGFTEKGVCYGTQPAPTIDDNKVAYDTVSTQATYTVKLSGLNYATKYYARAYATDASGTIYGDELTFTTMPVAPTVTTADFTANTGTTANGGGNVTNDGGADVTARGVCYSTDHNPTISNSMTSDGSGTGTFTSSLSNLKGLTTYYVRAYATNSAGTNYGNEVSFTTPKAIVTLWIAGDYQGWDPGGATDSLMNTDADPTVKGYAYISTTGGFKFVGEKDWNGTNYGDGGSAGTLSTDPGAGNLSVSTPGYYWFNLDLNNLTYTATLTTWGVIGAATADGWNSDQAMTYSPLLKRWFATIPMTADEFKFRANGAWDINYGAGAEAGQLEFNGSTNLAATTAGTYSVMLDLSAPLNPNYALTQWSIIGAVTAGGDWSTDLDMTPNSDNTWTVTGTFPAGEFKFRANHDWTINFGEGATAGTLKFGGSNLSIATAGTYTITLDLANGTFTIL